MSEDRNPLEEIVGTVAFTMPEMHGYGDRAGVLFHIKIDRDDHATKSEVVKWLLDVVERAGGEMHWELCGLGDTTEV